MARIDEGEAALRKLLGLDPRTGEPLDETRKLLAKRQHRVVRWGRPARGGRSLRVEDVPYFSARGMRRVYQRTDRFGHRSLHLNVWRTRAGRLLARFWSRSYDVDGYSYEVIGPLPTVRGQPAEAATGEQFVPACLRDEYENWVVSEMPFSYSEYFTSTSD